MKPREIILTEEQKQRIKACQSTQELHELMEDLGYNLMDSEMKAFDHVMRNDEKFKKSRKDAMIGKAPQWHDPGPE